jgi:hypothetical protein
MSELMFFKEPEAKRITVIRRAHSGLSARTAADMRGLSTHQAFRPKARVRAADDKGIRYGNSGRQPYDAKPQDLRQQVLDLH